MTRTEPPRPGRNDPCYCGSGRKYKYCHLSIDQQASVSPAQRLHDLDGRMTADLCAYARNRFGAAWRHFEDDFVDAEASAQLSLAWAVFHFRIDGVTAVDRYLEEKGRYLSGEERAWLDAQKAAWVSVWEVLAVEPGKSVTLRDLLSGEERRASEASASHTLVERDAMLARVVDHGGLSLLCGAHPQPLPPPSAADVVQRVRKVLHARGPVAPGRLRDEVSGRALIRCWEEAIELLEARPRVPQELRNTDGDPFLLTTDHFDIVPGAAPAVAATLATLPGAEAPGSGGKEGEYVFKRPGNAMHRSWDHTIVGHAFIAGGTLRLETNSRERAGALRARVEAACGAQIRHRLREHADPLSQKAPRGRKETASTIPPAEAARLVHEFKTHHYRDWLDQSLPALGGKTPRQAVRTTKGRAAVDVLLKDIENMEQRHEETPFDVAWLRRELGLDDQPKHE